jgi:hypothetical protein
MSLSIELIRDACFTCEHIDAIAIRMVKDVVIPFECTHLRQIVDDTN